MADGNHRPPLQEHGNLEIYRGFYYSTYCVNPIITHDGISVRFRKNSFAHIVQESSKRDGVKDTLSPERAKRLGWIKLALQDPNLELKAGWDSKKKIHDHKRRVTVMVDNFVVVLSITAATKAEFITCFVADDTRTQQKLLQAPAWKNPYV